MPKNQSTVSAVSKVKVNLTPQKSQYRTRAIKNSGESANWRLDLYKSNDSSFAKVLNLAIKNNRMVKHKEVSKAKLGEPLPQVKHYKQYGKKKPVTVSPSSHVKSSKRKPIKNCKVSEQTAGIPCKNRFQVL